jgi:predicted metal-binding protein
MDLKLDQEKYNLREYKKFNTELIIFDQAVRDICKSNTCGQYNRNHMCPPAVKEIDEWKKDIYAFKHGIILTKVYQAKSSYDIKAMYEGIKDFQNTLVKIKKNIKDKLPEMDYLLLGAGACFVCDKCSYIEKEPCRFPEKTFTSIEACGIDVMRLSKTAGVQYNNGKNTITYIGAILYK